MEEYKKHWGKYEAWIKEYESASQKLAKINFKELTSKELLDLFLEFKNLNIRFWLIVHVPEIANWGGEYILKKDLKN